MKIEKKTLRWIIYFFVGMAALTFLSRAADSMTVPRVQVVTSGRGNLNHSVEGTGSVTTEKEQVVFLPSGGKPISFAAQGTNLEKGDVLAVFDVDSLKEKKEKAEAELQKLELSMQQQAVSGEPAAQLLEQDGAMRTVNQRGAELNEIRQQLNEKRQEYQIMQEKEPEENEPEQKEAYEAQKKELELQIQTLESQEAAGLRALEEAQNQYADAQIRDEITRSSNERQRQASSLAGQGLQVDIDQMRKEVSRLDGLIQSEGKIYAPIGGNVLEASLTIGSETGGGEYIRIGMGNDRMTAELEKEEVLGLKEKDRLSVTNSNGKEAKGTVLEVLDVSETEDKASGKGAKVRILASLSENEFHAGEAVTFRGEMKSKEYNTLIPVSALREDNEGRFVLVLEEKSSILGKEMRASRVAVKVLERDRSNAAVESALMKGDQIIVSSNKSIKAGDRVRLE